MTPTPEPLAATPPPRRPFRRPGLVIGLLALVVLAGLMGSRLGQSRRALAACKARLVAQGEKLEIEEVVSPPRPASDAAYGRFLSAARTLRGRSIQPGSFQFVPLDAPGEMTPLTRVFDLNESGHRGVTWPEWEAELGELRAELDALHALLRSPPRRSALDYRAPFARLPDLVDRRYAAQWIAGEALAAAHAGDLPATQSALRSLLGLVELHEEDPGLVNQMVRGGIAGLAFDVTCQALALPGWTDPELAGFQSAWARLQFLDRLAHALEVERAWMLEIFERSRAQGMRAAGLYGARPTVSPRTLFQDYVVDPFWQIAWADEDEIFFLNHYQEMLDIVRSSRQHPSWPLLRSRLAQVAATSPERAEGLQALRYSLSRAGLPDWSRVVELQLRAETQRSLCLAALALRRHELRSGSVAPALAALVPQLLEAPPLDPMSGHPLRYGFGPDGRWRLYSVGADGRDDGGEPRPALAWQPCRGIWDGADAVWPRTATGPDPGPVVPRTPVLPLIQFEDAPLGPVLEALAREIGVTLVLDPVLQPRLQETVNLRLENVSAADVLEAVLRNQGLQAVRHGRTNRLGITRR